MKDKTIDRVYADDESDLCDWGSADLKFGLEVFHDRNQALSHALIAAKSTRHPYAVMDIPIPRDPESLCKVEIVTPSDSSYRN